MAKNIKDIPFAKPYSVQEWRYHIFSISGIQEVDYSTLKTKAFDDIVKEIEKAIPPPKDQYRCSPFAEPIVMSLNAVLESFKVHNFFLVILISNQLPPGLKGVHRELREFIFHDAITSIINSMEADRGSPDSLINAYTPTFAIVNGNWQLTFTTVRRLR